MLCCIIHSISLKTTEVQGYVNLLFLVGWGRHTTTQQVNPPRWLRVKTHIYMHAMGKKRVNQSRSREEGGAETE
jgi:hypothetical protein